MNLRTDLALDTVEMQPQRTLNGVRNLVRTVQGVQISTLSIYNEAGAAALGKPQGSYLTLQTDARMANAAQRETLQAQLCTQLKKLLPESGTVLVVGLGNESITPDALGPKCVARLFATRHITRELAAQVGLGSLRSVAAVAPGVLGQTGIETAEIVEALVEKVNPRAVLVVDALASCSLSRLGSTIQLTDTGISPGSGVGNRRAELSARTLGVPVVALGVPTVVDATTLTLNVLEELGVTPDAAPLKDAEHRRMMVTPKEIDLLIDRAAQVISTAINLALQPNLTETELSTIMQ